MPSLTVFPTRPILTMRLAQKAGFDGVELLLAGRVLKCPGLYAQMGRYMGLEVRFHQAWTPKNSSSPGIIWHILAFAGWLPKNSSSVLTQVPATVEGVPVVVYADTFSPSHPDNFHFQTMSVRDEDGEDGYAISFERFTRYLALAKRYDGQKPLHLVLDTFHFLEWGCGLRQIVNDPAKTERAFETLIEWFGGHHRLITEIHFSDYCPEKGRNVWPGTGIVPFEELAKEIRRVNWNGIVTPEIRPILRLNPLPELRRLLHDTKALLEQ